MCDVCKTHKKDTYQINGPSKHQVRVWSTLYNVYQNLYAKVELCRYHDIELFKSGEKEFFSQYLGLHGHLKGESERFRYKN